VVEVEQRARASPFRSIADVDVDGDGEVEVLAGTNDGAAAAVMKGATVGNEIDKEERDDEAAWAPFGKMVFECYTTLLAIK
jgi:hypothetical protein